MARYTRNSVLRARGLRPSEINALRADNRRLRVKADALEPVTRLAVDAMHALGDIVETTRPVIEAARERGTDASGTIRRIHRLAVQGLPY